jgi:ABC-type polysaccharide/polyol phosphate export permease
MSLYLSAGNVYYRDVGSALELGGLLMFYLTPIIYPVTLAYQRLQESSAALPTLYMLNPMAAIAVALRRVVLFPQGSVELPDSHLAGYFACAAALAVMLTLSGWVFFRKLSRNFADEL